MMYPFPFCILPHGPKLNCFIQSVITSGPLPNEMAESPASPHLSVGLGGIEDGALPAIHQMDIGSPVYLQHASIWMSYGQIHSVRKMNLRRFYMEML